MEEFEVFRGTEVSEKFDMKDGVINIGWDDIVVYPNKNGDICILQSTPHHGHDSIILVPALYCQTLIEYIKKAADGYED
jgi:hypothetical protein